MAYLKLGSAVTECDPVEGEAYIQKAQDILVEMEKLQAVDPEGGVLYAISESGVITDFPQAPSAAGTTWLLMVLRAMDDEAMRDAFWGPDPGIIHCVGISGPTTGWVNTPHTFVAAVHPATVTLPISYVWHTGLLSPVLHRGGMSDTLTLTWGTPGPKSIVVEATNTQNTVTHTHMIRVTDDLYLPFVLMSAP
jgi:hypothetical protein